ncbi:hypothetical protein WJX79_008823 [Trebouxia sp. C0005]
MSATLQLLASKKAQLEQELSHLEKQLYEKEGHYLGAEHSQHGNVIKGFEGFLSSKDVLKRRTRAFKTSELQQAEEATMQDGERPHIGRSARHASKTAAAKAAARNKR